MSSYHLLSSLVLFCFTCTTSKNGGDVNASTTQLWQVDMDNSSVLPFYHFWDECVGSGHASLALREDYRYELEEASNAIGFKYVRFHGILDDDVGCVNGVNDYSFVNIDNIFDFLVSINMKPYVEISFMPEYLASDSSSTVFHYKGGISSPSSFNTWYSFIHTLIEHLVDRYGIDQVSQWPFEVWNEPNCGFYYQGGCCGCDNCGDIKEYFLLYNSTYLAIKVEIEIIFFSFVFVVLFFFCTRFVVASLFFF